MAKFGLKSFCSKKEEGYSLIEISIVLIIMGTLASFSLPLLTDFMSASKLKITQTHQEQVLKSLAAYVMLHHRLPCPADPNNKGENRGEARGKCPGEADCIGIIPYRTLGIPEEIAKDGYHHFMTYAVNPELADNLGMGSTGIVPTDHSTGPKKYCKWDKKPLLKVFYSDEKRSPVQASTGKELPLAVVLLSEGDAYQKPLTRLETENKSLQLKFYDPGGGSRKELRHVVRWITSWDLLSSYADVSCAAVLHTQGVLNPEVPQGRPSETKADVSSFPPKKKEKF